MNFFTKNPNLKYNIFWGVGVIEGRGGVGWGSVARIVWLEGSVTRISDFFTKNPNLKKKI